MPTAGTLADTSTLLIVDDEPMIVMYLESKLQALGYRVFSATTASEAVELARSYGPLDAALIDLALGDPSGLELISQLREVQEDLCVIIASGYADMAARDLDGGPASAVLGKPFDAGTLARCLRTLGLEANRTRVAN